MSHSSRLWVGGLNPRPFTRVRCLIRRALALKPTKFRVFAEGATWLVVAGLVFLRIRAAFVTSERSERVEFTFVNQGVSQFTFVNGQSVVSLPMLLLKNHHHEKFASNHPQSLL